ncbi:MAG: orotidine-5'-phosphate decarboxylase, partial [Planctomycetota bacterium]
MSWTDRFQERGSALCVGLDPVAARLPAGETIGSFCEKVVARTAEHAACFKPNIAFFEVMGAAGLEELARVFAACRKEGVPVLLDAKRGDIGSTAQLYAEAYLADTDLGADALTVNASLGLDTLEPLLAMARAHDRGLFVLLRTSNPGAPTFQDGMEPML